MYKAKLPSVADDVADNLEVQGITDNSLFVKAARPFPAFVSSSYAGVLEIKFSPKIILKRSLFIEKETGSHTACESNRTDNSEHSIERIVRLSELKALLVIRLLSSIARSYLAR